MDGYAVKRDRWTESDIDALPAGEHDYFERKSGQLFTDIGDLLGKLAKTISAMANSGGGHVVLGVDDFGTPDGAPRMHGGTAVRDWLEQKIPHREAGRSEPAPHFYLELLRQRLVAPALDTNLVDLFTMKAAKVEDGVFLALRLRFLVKNTGRVAAYKWQLQVTEMGGHSPSRVADYRFRSRDYPPGLIMDSAIRIDDTILPGCALEEDKDLGLLLRPGSQSREALRAELETLLLPFTLGFRVATEVSPGHVEHVELRSIVNIERLVDFVAKSQGLESA